MAGRALTRRCPRCGSGHLFRRWFSMVEHCPRCGWRFERQPGFALGAMAINIGVTMLAFAVVAVVGVAVTLPHIPVLRLTVIAATVNVVLPVAFYPFSKTVWAAIDLAMRPLDAAEEADARRARDEQPPPD